MAFGNFDVSLVPNESGLVAIGQGGARAVKYGGITILEGVRPGPETFSQAGTHRVDERRIRMVGEQVLEQIDINGSDDLKEGRIVIQGADSNGIVELRRRGTRKTRRRF